MNTLNNLMLNLYLFFQPFFEKKLFKAIMDITVFLNPIAIFPQVLVSFTSPNLEGISIAMWGVFASIQTAFIFHGIKMQSKSMFLSMAISLMESLTIIIVVLVRN